MCVPFLVESLTKNSVVVWSQNPKFAAPEIRNSDRHSRGAPPLFKSSDVLWFDLYGVETFCWTHISPKGITPLANFLVFPRRSRSCVPISPKAFLFRYALLEHGILKLHLRLKVFGDYYSENSERNYNSEVLTLQQLNEKYRKTPTDFTLICKDGEPIETHKYALRAVSPVFEALFTNEYKDNIEGEVTLAEPVEIVKSFISFVYTGTINGLNNEIDMKTLFSLAHRFQVKELESFCLRKISKSVTSENVVDLLIHVKRCGSLQSDTSTVQNLIHFIEDHDVSSHPSYDKLLEHPDLMMMLLKNGRSRGSKRNYENTDWGYAKRQRVN